MYCVCFEQTISLALYPPIFGCKNTIDGSFTDSYSACYSNQSGGKDIKTVIGHLPKRRSTYIHILPPLSLCGGL